MDLRFEAEQRDRTVAFIRDHLGSCVGAQAARLDDDELEELAFRVHCGEYRRR